MEELHPDLFGGETPIKEQQHNLSFKDKIGYKKAEKGEPSCKTCPHLMRKRFNMKNYYKCENLGDSNSEATDIRLSGTCRYHPDKL